MLLKEMIALYFENHVIHFGLDIFFVQKTFCGFLFSSCLDIPNGLQDHTQTHHAR